MYEIKKLVRRPITIIAFLIVCCVFLMNIVLDENGEIVDIQAIEAEKVEKANYTGAINEEWTNEIQVRLSQVINNPNNWMSKEERKEFTNSYLERGYTDEYIQNLPNNAFLTSQTLNSIQYRSLVEAESAATFYENAKQVAVQKGDFYRKTFEGNKGEALASRAEEMYHDLGDQYVANFGYNKGWIKLFSIQNRMPYTIGMFLIIVLTPIFSEEYSHKTLSSLFTSKYGKKRLIRSKIIAALVITTGTWLITHIVNISLVALIYGLEGYGTFVQDWVFDFSPFLWTMGSTYIAVILMNLLGMYFFASVALYVSTKTKNPFTTLVVSALMLLFPTLIFNQFIPFLPANILIGQHHFRNFMGYYILGNVVLMQQLIPILVILFSMVLIYRASKSFYKKQVEN